MNISRAVGLSVLALAASAGMANAAIVYSWATESGQRATPGAGSIFFDDVFIDNLLVGGNTDITLNTVTVGIRRVTGAAAVDVTIWAAPMLGTNYGVSGIIGAPISLGTVSFGANAGASVTSLAVVNPGVTLALNSLVTGAAPNFSGLFIGVSFSNTDPLNGWRVVSGGSAGANFTDRFVNFVGGVGTVVGFAPPTPNAFYTIVDGTFVPTPGAAGLLGLGGLMVARRRRA